MTQRRREVQSCSKQKIREICEIRLIRDSDKIVSHGVHGGKEDYISLHLS